MPKIPVLRVKEWLRQTGNSLKATAMQKTTLREIKRVSLVVFALEAIDPIWNRNKEMQILLTEVKGVAKKTCNYCGNEYEEEYEGTLDNGSPACPECVAKEERKLEENQRKED